MKSLEAHSFKWQFCNETKSYVTIPIIEVLISYKNCHCNRIAVKSTFLLEKEKQLSLILDGAKKFAPSKRMNTHLETRIKARNLNGLNDTRMTWADIQNYSSIKYKDEYQKSKRTIECRIFISLLYLIPVWALKSQKQQRFHERTKIGITRFRFEKQITNLVLH